MQPSAMFPLLLRFGHKCISEIWGRLNRQHVVHIWNIQLSDVLLTNGKSSQTGAQRGFCWNPEWFPLIVYCNAFMWSLNGLCLCGDFSNQVHEIFIKRQRIFVCFDSSIISFRWINKSHEWIMLRTGVIVVSGLFWISGFVSFQNVHWVRVREECNGINGVHTLSLSLSPFHSIRSN